MSLLHVVRSLVPRWSKNLFLAKKKRKNLSSRGIWTRKSVRIKVHSFLRRKKNTPFILNPDWYRTVSVWFRFLNFISHSYRIILNRTNVLFLSGVWTSLYILHRLDQRRLLTLTLSLILLDLHSRPKQKSPNCIESTSLHFFKPNFNPCMQLIFCTSIPNIPTTNSSRVLPNLLQSLIISSSQLHFNSILTPQFEISNSLKLKIAHRCWWWEPNCATANNKNWRT